MSQARRTVVRLPPDQQTLDQRIDASLNVPLANRRSWITIRAVALLTTGALAAIFLPGGRGFVIAALLAADLALQPLAARAARGRDLGPMIAALNITTAAVAIAVEYRLWTAALCWMISVTIWQSIIGTARRSIALLAYSIVAACVVGPGTGIDEWWIAVVTVGVLGGSYIGFGRAMRWEFRSEEVETLETMSLGGAIVHRTDLETSTIEHLRGDISVVTGYPIEHWLAADHRELIHPDDLETFWLSAEDVQPNTIIDRVARYRRANGSWVWLRDVSRVVVDRRGHRSLRGILIDVTDSEEHREELARLARIDLLTGLPNRLALHDELTIRLVDGDHFALLLLDLDRFKEVNDTLGHEAGDEVLRIIASRLDHAVGTDDLLTRIGGDEFAIVIPGRPDPDRLDAYAERVNAVCSAPISVGNVDLALSQSCGIALSSAADERATVMRHADIAMYAAKRAGHSHRIFDDSLEQTSTMQLSLSAGLADAIRKRDIELFYQPKIDLRSGRLVGAEGLVRWRHDELGLLSPAAFLELALLSESSSALLRSTLEQALDMVRTTIDLGRPTPVAVNIAFASIRDIGFTDDLTALLDRHEVPPDMLTLEFTENDVDRPSDETVAVVNQLSATGLDISIDDFGTGHSSLERLITLHVDELKIDRVFVQRVLEDGHERRIIQTIIDLADRLGANVVAEGIESEEQASALAAMGCTVGQGYLFAPALPADDFIELVRASAADQVDESSDLVGAHQRCDDLDPDEVRTG